MSKSNKLPKTFIDLDRLFGRCRNRVHRVGVELEGLWNELPAGVRVERDGSVRGFDASLQRLSSQIGEIPSRPMTTAEMPNWVRQFYPHHVNSSCGLHTHMSFRFPATYQRLMDETYPATIVEYIKRWAIKEQLPKDNQLWQRLAGTSVYCQHLYQADQQVLACSKHYDHHAPGHRYTVINYAFKMHETVECRLLNAFEDVEQSIRALQEVIRITNAFLVMSSRKTKKVQASYLIEEEIHQEEYNEVV